MRLVSLLLVAGTLICGVVYLCSSSRATGQAKDLPAQESNKAFAEFKVGTDGRPLYIEGIVGGKPVLFLIDTNVSKTILDASLRPLLGESKGCIDVETTGDRISVESFASPTIDLEQLTVQPSGSVACFDLRGFRAAGGADVRGVLGMDVLRRFVVTIDFDVGLVRLTEGLRDDDLVDTTEVPLTFISQIPLVQARAGGELRSFRIDTGSTDCCIQTELFRTLAERHELRTGPTYSVMTPSGPLAARFGILNHFQFASFDHDAVPFEDGPMSLLGLPYLARYRWTFDFPRGKAYIRSGRNFAHNDFLGTSGLALQRVDGRLVIVGIKPTSDAAKIAQVGDEVVALNGESADGIDMFRVRQVLTQRPGSPVELGLLRDDRKFACRLRTRDRLGTN